MINEKNCSNMTREEAVVRIKDHIKIHRYNERNAVKIFEALDMAIKALEQPKPNYDEWCTDCKEYDKEKHSCPRWSKVIRNTVNELKSTQPEQQWIPVKERNPIEYDNPIEFMATLEDPSGERYVEFVEWDGYEWDDFYTDDNERGVWGHDRVIAWMKKPEPFKGD